jgi:hypothetical protein
MDAYRRMLPRQLTSVSPTGLQDDFNYGAYASRGTQIWPQAYGATYATLFDPETVRNRVVANNVDPNLVTPILAPGQKGSGHLYALEDFRGQYPQAQAPGPVRQLFNQPAQAQAPQLPEWMRRVLGS